MNAFFLLPPDVAIMLLLLIWPCYVTKLRLYFYLLCTCYFEECKLPWAGGLQLL